MNILITGANGQLGNEMRIISKSTDSHNWFFTDVAELDITDREAIRKFVADNGIEAIVNCAAYTNVDKAEDDEPSAYKINAVAVENLAAVAAEKNALLVHVSTDYVFDGNSFLPYKETDPTSPYTVYGRTKLQGEQLAMQVCPWTIIVRTAWLYSSFGNNFVKTMLRLGREREALSVVYDQVGSPTYAADLAQAIYVIISKIDNESREAFINQAKGEVYHFSNLGVCSWYDFTVEIHRQAGIECAVSPIRSEQYPAKTPRPHYSVLDKQKIVEHYGLNIPHWTVSLAKCLQILEG